jgi:multicomponent Na+:H+ antiporter subunit B
MTWQVDFGLMLVLVLLAILALETRDLLAAVGILTGFSLLMALVFAELGAPDVALTEAALGAGLTGVLLLVALARTGRDSED